MSAEEKKKQNHEAQTMWQIVRTQFAEHRMAVLGVRTLFVMCLIAICAPLISKLYGVGPDDQNVFKRYQGAFTTIEASRDQQNEAFEGFVTDSPERAEILLEQMAAKGLVQKDSSQSTEDILLDFFDARDETLADQLQSLNSSEGEQLLQLMSRFKTFHLLGTDELGRDVLMRLIYGARISLGVGILVALASALVGLLVGSLAGYYGGWVDTVLMRITDSLLALPILPLMIVFAAVELKKVPLLGELITGQNESIMKLVIILVIFSWMQAARLIRGSILTVREREFVLAAQTLGAKDSMIIKTHIIPNVIAPLLVAVTLNVGNSILWEAALSFLGLGIQPPTPSWGNILFNAQEIVHQAPLLAIMPGVLIFLTVISFNFIGDGLQDAIDPKTIRR